MSCPNSSQWDLLAVGALEAGPAETLAAHAEHCSACRRLFAAARRAHVERLRTYEAFDRDHDSLRDALLAELPAEAPVRPGAAAARFRRLGDWIMSLNTRTARNVAAVLAPAACILVALVVLLVPSRQSAFAAAVERLRSARTIVAQFDAYLNHSDTPMQSGTLYLSDEHGLRFDAVANPLAMPGVPNVMGMTMFHQPGGAVVLIHPQLNVAIRMHMPEGKMHGWSGGWDQSAPDQFLAGFRRLTGDADADLGRSVIDGRDVEGFEISAAKLGLEYVGRKADESTAPSRARLWVDADSHLPVRMEVDVATDSPMGPMHVQAVYDGFEFDEPLDAARFEPVIPAGARLVDVNVPAPSEETLLSALRLFAEKTGRFPATLDPARMSAELMVTLARERGAAIDPEDPGSLLNTEMMETAMNVAIGCAYVQQLAREGREPEYMGDIVSPEDGTEILLNWRLPSGKTRVIHADLSATTQS